MLSTLSLVFFLTRPSLPRLFLQGHAGFETQDFQGDPGFVAQVDGKNRKLVLSTRWPTSYMLNGDRKLHTVVVGGKTLVKTAFAPIGKSAMYPNADGVLGADALRKVCLVVDPLWKRIEPLPGPKIGLAGAKAYFAKLPAWGGDSKVVKVPLGRTIMGTPTVKIALGGTTTTMILTLSPYNTMIDKTVRGAPARTGGDWAFLPNLTLPGLAPSWAAYGTLEAKHWDARSEGGYGMLGLDAFASRRAIVDLADDAVYVEELSPDARLSAFLACQTCMPLAVAGDSIGIAGLPGLFDEENVGPMLGSKVVRLAGDAAADWLKDLRARTPEAVARITKRFHRMNDDFEIDVVDPDGNERTFTIPGRERPSDALVSPVD